MSPPAIEREPKPMERIGDILKRERERRGDDLQYIAEYLCIRPSLLRAIENSRYEEFAADAYIVGFLRSYAEYLGLDGKDTINYYRREMAGRRKKPSLSMPMPISEGRAPSAMLLGAAAVFTLVVYIMWYAFSSSDRATVSTPAPLPPPVAETQMPMTPPTPVTAEAFVTAPAVTPEVAALAPAANAPPEPKPAAPTAATAAPVVAPAPPPHLLVSVQQVSWVLIADSTGHTVFDRVMKPGEAYKVPDGKGYTLTTGNGAGITLLLDGKPLPKLSRESSRILRNVPLSDAALKALPGMPEE